MEEASRTVSDVIYIIKKEGQVSEQVLPLLVNSFDISALEGKQSPPYIYLPMLQAQSVMIVQWCINEHVQK